MRRVRCLKLLIGITVSWCVSSSVATAEPTVWTGLTYSFVSTVEAPAQDMITPDVIFARGTTFGLYNAASESSYSSNYSPESTLWATEFNNPGANVSANNWADLSFTDWQTAYGSAGALSGNIVGSDTVLYLELDDVYLDVRFTQWGNGRMGDGGSFSYLRAEPIPEPATFILAAAALLALGRRRRKSSEILV